MKQLTKTFASIALGAAIVSPAAFAGGLTDQQILDERANLHADGSLPFVHSVEFYGRGTSNVVITAEHQDELDNLYADGSLPFVHSPDGFGQQQVAGEVIWTEERLAEFRNLRSDGSLL